MREYDRLPAELRGWLAEAMLPWSPRLVRRAYAKAHAAFRDADRALAELDRMEARLVARDAGKVWGTAHPSAGSQHDG